MRAIVYLVITSLLLVCFTGCGILYNQTRSKSTKISSKPTGANYAIYDKAEQLKKSGVTPTDVIWLDSYDTVKFDMSGFPSQTTKNKKNKFNIGFLGDIALIGVGIYFYSSPAEDKKDEYGNSTGEKDDSGKSLGMLYGGIGALGLVADIFTGNFLTYRNEVSVDFNQPTRTQTQRTRTNSGMPGIEQAISTAIQQAITRVTRNSIIAVISITTSDNTLQEFVTSEAEYILLNQGFSVVDRVQLDKVRTEQRLQTSGEIDSRTMSSLGRFSGANFILTGRIDYDGGQQTLWLRVLDVQTSDIIGTAQVAFGDSQPIANPIGIEDAVLVAIEQATTKIPPSSKLAIVNVEADNDTWEALSIAVDQALSRVPTKDRMPLENVFSIKDFLTGESEYTLVNQGYKVVDRGDLEKIRREQGFQVSGEVDDRTAVSIGKIAGADYLINIRADGRGGLTRLRWRILNTQTALLAGTASVPYLGVSSKTPALSIEEALVQAISQATEKVVKGSRVAIIQIATKDTAAREYVLGEAGHILISQGYRVSNRSELDRIRQEQGLQYSGDVDDNTAVSLGKISGVRYLITGRIDGADSLRRLRLRILDTETAEVAGVASVRF